MILIVQIVIILVLAFMLISVYMQEIHDRKGQRPHGLVEEVWLGEERRKSVRVSSRLEVVYSYDKKSKYIKRAYTENISNGGLKMLAEEKLETNAPLVLEIHTPGSDRPILARGEVVWVDETPRSGERGRRVYGAGIKFTDLKQLDKDRFAHLIENIQKNQ
jgi:c-di-GMP-binding flagellar brake protein YcgR